MSIELLSYTPLLLALVAAPLLGLALAVSLVDRPRGRRVGSWALRVTGVLLLILALCRPQLGLPSNAAHVTFLVDVSESVDLAGVEQAVGEVKQAIAMLDAGDSWDMFALGSDIRRYESPDALRDELQRWRDGAADDRFRSATATGAALQRLRATMPDDKAKRVVLMSDRQPTDGQLAEAMQALKQEGIDLQVADVPGLRDAEAAVLSIEPSTQRAFEGEIVRLTVKMATNTAMDGELRILSRGAVAARKQVSLQPGDDNTARIDVAMHTPGPSVWTAELVPDRDRFPINNQAACTVQVHGQPRLLVLHEHPREMRQARRALEQQQFTVDVRPPHGLPEAMNELLAFDAVVLADAPATAMSVRQMLMLQHYVADFGGGLLMLGSENSFGLGGYYKTPVEEVLPLVSRFEKEKEKPSMAMVLVIDKSGSMDGVPIALARQAARATAELLSPRDQIAVVAFDSEAYVVSEMRAASDLESIRAAIGRIGAGGGTFMYRGMDVARGLLEDARARIKHMIVLGDGQTQSADHFGLVTTLADQGVTVSTVALGDGADRHLLAGIADHGGGRYYETRDPANVPQIFTRETMHASRSAIREDVFASVQVADHPALSGFATQGLPFTLGYVMTQAKPTARVLLATETGDPLLAASRFGLGTGMAYTSDLTPKWGGQWLAWDSFGQFWSQVLRALVRKIDDRGIVVHAETDADTWDLDVRRRDAQGRPVSGVTWDAELLDDAGNRQPVELAEVGLGRYAATVPFAEQRRLTLRLRDTDHNRLKALHHHRPYPAEYRLSQNVPHVLAEAAPFDIERLTADLPPASHRQPLMPWLTLLAIACLIAGVALRRV